MARFCEMEAFFYEDQMMADEAFISDALARKLGHVFGCPSLLKDALTHPSFVGAKKGKKKAFSPYERLEFLGDRVLGLVMAEWLYALYPNATEGELAKRHAALVNRDALKFVAESIGLEEDLRLAHGEAIGVDRKNLAVLSDAMEAVIGALYLDAGLEPAERLIRRYWEPIIHEEKAPCDPKTSLQEWAQGRGLPLPTYKVISRTGPAHAPQFEIEVSVKGVPPVRSNGNSKREAEKTCAELLLKAVEEI